MEGQLNLSEALKVYEIYKQNPEEYKDFMEFVEKVLIPDSTGMVKRIIPLMNETFKEKEG